MTVPLVSVIIPCRDAGATLRRCLESVYAQTHPRLEVVVVDNGSGDDSVNIVEGLAARHDTPLTLAHCPVPGANNARNQGFGLARGDYIQWLDTDDTIHPHKVALQVNALERHGSATVAYGDWRWRFPLSGHDWRSQAQAIVSGSTAVAYGVRRWVLSSTPSRHLERRLRLAQFDDFLLRLLQDMWLPPNAYLLHRSVAERLHGIEAFHPRRRVAMDREYISLAAVLGAEFLHVPGAWADYFTWRPDQLSRTVPVAERGRELADIFTRLHVIATRPGAPALTDAHHFLLQQDWGLWSLTTPFPGPPPREGPREQWDEAILATLRHNPRSRLLEGHAKVVAHHIPALWERHLEILQALHRLAAAGALRTAPGVSP